MLALLHNHQIITGRISRKHPLKTVARKTDAVRPFGVRMTQCALLLLGQTQLAEPIATIARLD